jgi:sugar lactone lactonase YvrE
MMQHQTSFQRLDCLWASALLVAGCGAQQLTPANALPAAPTTSNAKGGAYAYTCQSESSHVDCLVFRGTKLVRTLTKGLKKPLGVAAGKDGMFYVADAAAKDIFVYSAGGAKLVATLSDGSNAPVDVAVYNDEVAASNKNTLTFFKKGATKPTLTLKDTTAVQGSGAAFDSAGDCYWSFTTKSGASVDEFKGCKGKPANLKIAPGTPYGIAFDGNGNLYYTSYNGLGKGIYACSGVKSCALAFTNIPFVDPQYLNFSSDFADVWIDDPGDYGCYCNGLYEIDLKTGKQVAKILRGMSFFDPPTGVAAGPGPL